MADYPSLPPYEGTTDNWGKNIQRTMHLLETSTYENPNTVRILFYGQSVVGGQWHKHVERWLKEKYPHANLIIENRAIGGYSAAYLYRTANYDLHPFYPDLMIFHVYGHHIHYEELIHDARQKTTTEIMIMTDHWRAATEDWKVSNWANFFDKRLLPQVAEKYDCELVDVRWPWKQYIIENNLETKDVLKDNVHLNEMGLWLMAQLCMRHMIYRPELMTEEARSLTTDYTIGDDVSFDEDGVLKLEFYGNRVDLIAHGAGLNQFEILIDGKKPSDLPESYYFTRPSPLLPPATWTNIYKMSSCAQLIEEDWILEITEIDEAGENFRFKLTGTKTGFDGEGSNSELFVSDSGRVVIDPEDWAIARSVGQTGKPPPVGSKTLWSSVFSGLDYYRQPSALGKKTETTIYQGGSAKKHTLTLKAFTETDNSLRAIRVYTPPIPAGPFKDLGLDPNEQVDESKISAPTPD